MRKFLPFLTALVGAPILSLLIANTLMHFGDKAFTSDRLGHARVLYHLSQVFNPFNNETSRRLLAVNVNIEERTQESEETSDPKHNIAQAPSNVLGVTSCVPVLMYHYIRVNPWPTDTVGFGLSTPPYIFSQELDYLQKQGYQTITLADLKDQIELHKAMDIKKTNPSYKLPRTKLLPDKPIIITLDDGYEDAYLQGLPILKAHNMTAVEFVITGFVGLPNYLTWNEIAAMDKSGVFEMESHTVHHYALGGTYWSEKVLMNELTQSKEDLETHLGKAVEWFAYPYGSVNDRAATDAARIYYAAFGTNFGAYQSTEEQYTLPRVRVSGGDWGPSIDTRIRNALQDAKCVKS